MARIDWGLTEDGDLDLGAPRVNAENQILYYHKHDESVDTSEIKDGIAGVMLRDLVYTTGRHALKQTIHSRLRTDAPDWYHHPSMGGNLTDLIGEPNTRETGEWGAELIMQAMTYDGMLSPLQLSIRPTPISDTDIVFFVTVALDETETYRLPIHFSLSHGLKEF